MPGMKSCTARQLGLVLAFHALALIPPGTLAEEKTA
jgi:hypothetical protein